MNHITTLPVSAMLATDDATMPDLQLAKTLGYKRLTNIRNLIARNRASLEDIGSLLQREAMIETAKGARREVTEFHLTKAQATFLIAKAGTKEADNVLILVSEAFAMLAQGKLVAVDEAAQAELDAAAERARLRYQAMREDKHDFSRIVGGFGRAPSRKLIGTAPDGTPIYSELTPFEKRKAKEKAARRRQ